MMKFVKRMLICTNFSLLNSCALRELCATALVQYNMHIENASIKVRYDNSYMCLFNVDRRGDGMPESICLNFLFSEIKQES